jgi:hypothetical protein
MALGRLGKINIKTLLPKHPEKHKTLINHDFRKNKSPETG